MHDFSLFKNKIKDTEDFLVKELSSVRTGRATTSLLDTVLVDAYGSKMQIKELASINLEDPRTIKIEPYDQNIAKEIERALGSSGLGLGLGPYEKGLRVIFPELTSERRDEFVKLARKKLEEAKIALRSLRDKEWTLIQEKEKSGSISEDVKFRLKDEMQKIVDLANKDLEALVVKKENEIRQ